MKCRGKIMAKKKIYIMFRKIGCTYRISFYICNDVGIPINVVILIRLRTYIEIPENGYLLLYFYIEPFTIYYIY